MEKVIPFSISFVFTLILLYRSNQTMVTKPLPIFELSNGYPTSPYSKFNIQGKSNFTCNYIAGGNSVFLDQFVDSAISYMKNRKSTECQNNDLLSLDLVIANVVLKFGSFTNITGNMFLPQTRHLLV